MVESLISNIELEGQHNVLPLNWGLLQATDSIRRESKTIEQI